MQQREMSREQLHNWVNMTCLAVVDSALFLDTHPNDQNALEYFNYFNQLKNNAMKEYAERFTPLTLDTVPTGQQRWEWVYGQWPWEGGDY